MSGSRRGSGAWGARAIGLMMIAATMSGCGEDDRTPAEFAPSVRRNATAADDTVFRVAPAARATSIATPDSSATVSALVSLRPVAGGELTGDVRILSIGSAGAVTSRLASGTAGLTYEGAVRRGECEAIGGRVVGLVPVTTDGTGRGASYTQIGTNLRRLLSLPHIVTFGRGDEIVACGRIGGPRPEEPGDPARLSDESATVGAAPRIPVELVGRAMSPATAKAESSGHRGGHEAATPRS